ncbi:amino acid ABC transporter ATP-binding protein [Weissella viridescens]|uniref:amino acid ABC transporter ATP-binding protein n=1 Tax=Weissella viridescens TaxID=1629 RepID=UPI001746D50E|nr:ATP-binding cassette domain-containing protein [Weissella viridescens]MBX4172719.1 ATP-binding cassette domain-containing protein [Weissella viridescens]MCB6840365.1 ATP-binding cassette domain-containing protein [Weissella viridescens]MCB6847098.1 ATP-binding cassette domain-containing protein [Weissella viridescens]QOD86527.1 amino acid ABC transporter ATP-binding protein [Weissella viridescens]WJI91658.1 ATP-binding cassette domain-containing protein [Weissella viridescens]
MLEIKNLSKRYDDRVVFKNLNLTVADGEILTIIGPSGIGKTTFLRILAGLTPADSGSITLDGKPLAIDGTRSGADVGVIFQDFNLFPQYSVAENIELAPKLVAKKSAEAVAQETERLLNDMDLQAQRDQYPFQLSGGQKQRVAIARALAMQPGLLAYDEPTSGLDAASTQRVTDVTKDLQQRGVTQLIVTHDLPFAEAVQGRHFDFATDVER